MILGCGTRVFHLEVPPRSLEVPPQTLAGPHQEVSWPVSVSLSFVSLSLCLSVLLFRTTTLLLRIFGQAEKELTNSDFSPAATEGRLGGFSLL